MRLNVIMGNTYLVNIAIVDSRGSSVASGQGVGSVPRGQDGGLRRDGGRKGKDGNLDVMKCQKTQKVDF